MVISVSPVPPSNADNIVNYTVVASLETFLVNV
jgi:hypothetical protein